MAWKRRWRVTIGTLVSEDIDIRFKATRTLAPAPGTLELEVFNLTANHRAEARAASRPAVRLECGYQDEGIAIVFQGDARRVDTMRDGADWITKITAGDGQHALRTARAALSFAPDTSLTDVVRALAGTMGLGEGNVAQALAGAQLGRVGAAFPGGTVVHGRSRRALTRLMNSIGYEWSVQAGVLQVVPRGRALNRNAIVLSPSTGLLDSPEVAQDRSLTAKALLVPDLVPGRLVQLQSAVVQGVYRIEKAEYSGDTQGTDWLAALTLRHPTS